MTTDRTSFYRMMGRNVQVHYDESKGAAILEEELAAYPSASLDIADMGIAELVVRYAPVEYDGLRFANPAVHCEMEDGFIVRGRMATVRFRLDDTRLVGVDFYPASAQSLLMRGARRLADMQYTSREERAGVIFHEWVAGPAVYWLPDMALVHASAFSDARGVTLIGGAGGAGKTSLALELCRRYGFRFVADDISFVGEDGHVWPNLAWPKIYAYNVEGDPDLAQRLLGGRTAVDRLHWALHRRRGAACVRRRMAPDILYDGCGREGGPVFRYLMLVREDRPDLHISDISPARAAEMSVQVMRAEYAGFHNHLHWHAMHRALEDRPLSVSASGVFRRWRDMLTRVLGRAQCRLARIPRTMEHSAFRRRMTALLADAG